MTVSGTTNLLANYNNRASASAMEQSYDWLSFYVYEENGELVAQLSNPIDTTKQSYLDWESSEAGTNKEIIIPQTISVQVSGNYMTSNYCLVNGNNSTTIPSNAFTPPSLIGADGTYTAKVVNISVSVNSSLRNIVKKAVIPDTATRLNWNSVTLEDINIPYGVDFIAFNGCSSLKDIVIPNSVTKLYSNAFRNCDALESLIIPRSVSNIGSNSIIENDSLEQLIVLCENAEVETGTIVLPPSLTYFYCNSNEIMKHAIIMSADLNSFSNCIFVFNDNINYISQLFLSSIIANNGCEIHYTGSQEQFNKIFVGQNTTVAQITNSAVCTTSHVTYNCADPYAA